MGNVSQNMFEEIIATNIGNTASIRISGSHLEAICSTLSRSGDIFRKLFFGTVPGGTPGAILASSATPLGHCLDLLDDFGGNCSLHVNDVKAVFRIQRATQKCSNITAMIAYSIHQFYKPAQALSPMFLCNRVGGLTKHPEGITIQT